MNKFFYTIGLLALVQATTAQANVCNRTAAVSESLEQSLKRSCGEIKASDLADLEGLMVAQLFTTSANDTRVQAQDFIGLKNLETLVLYGAPNDPKALQIAPGTFAGLGNLTELHMQWYRDLNFTPGSFAGLVNLKRLILQFNKVYTPLTKQMLGDMPQLELLEVTGGAFLGVTEDVFDNSPNLKRVIFNHAYPTQEVIKKLEKRYPHIQF